LRHEPHLSRLDTNSLRIRDLGVDHKVDRAHVVSNAADYAAGDALLETAIDMGRLAAER
jgi:hypothetical protein